MTGSVLDLLAAAGAAVADDAVVAVAGELADAGASGSRFLCFEPSLGATGSLDSASAIVELERSRTRGAAFLALPAPTNVWLAELALFGDHCRSRYDVIFDSADVGAVIDLRARNTHSPDVQNDVSGGEVSEANDLDALDALAVSLSRLVRSDAYTAEEFRRFEQRGVHVTPVHFYQPIPDTSKLDDGLWDRVSELVGIDMDDSGQLHLLRDVFPQFRDEYEALPTAPTEDPACFHLGNGLFDGTDALALYCMLRHLRPRRVIEVGSGYSTRLAAQAALTNASTELVCIEPYPGDVVAQGFAGLTELIASRVEHVSLDLFTSLEAGDVLFIDSSHVVKTGGDVAFLFLEVLPRLRQGVVVHVHDVFLPHEYPRECVVDGLRFWNEQHLLQSFLMFNSEFRVLLANNYLATRYMDILKETFPTSPWWGGGSFWMQRVSA